MKNKNSDTAQRFLILLKIDSENLFNRIKERESIYMQHFSSKRDRSIFKEIFKNRYQDASMGDLANLPIEIIELADNFYSKVDELYWYLNHTEDMPNTIEDEVFRHIAGLGKKFNMLSLYISAELSGESPEKIERLTHDELQASTDSSERDFFISEDDLEDLDNSREQ